MGRPKQAEVEDKLLKLLAARSTPLRTSDAYRLLADECGLSAAERDARLEGTKESAWHNRVRWAKNALDKAGWADSIDDAL
jgi:restriction endonuclease Mrr